MIEKNRGKVEALLQILILVLGIVAISYAVGSSIEVVSASKITTSDALQVTNTVVSTANMMTGDAGIFGGGKLNLFGGSEISLIGDAGFGDTALINTAGESSGWLSNLFSEGAFGGITGGKSWLVDTAVYAGLIYLGIKVLDWIIGDEEWSAFLNRIATEAALAYVAGEAIAYILVETTSLSSIPVAGWIAAAAVIVWELITWRTEKQQIVTFQCAPWQPEIGGDKCEECNNQGLIPCSEYQCMSLGQACQLINVGTSDQKCISSKDDGKYPTITAWQDALLNEDYSYSPEQVMSPPDKGVYIDYDGEGQTTTHSENSKVGCVPAFTPISLGVTLNENAHCKISTTREIDYASMDNNKLLTGGLANESHYFQLSLPGGANLESENISLENGGNYELFVRCEDSFGHSNPANFVFKFCIEDGPDYTNPRVVMASPLNGLPIANDQDSTEATFYINEPAECRWSHLDENYETMANTMSCANSLSEMNSYMLYPCTTTLTGLENDKENKFYIRCEDKAENINTESYEYVLLGTEALILDWVTPNETLIKGPGNSVQVEIEAHTSAGYDDGEAICYYSESGEDGSYVPFYETSSYEHSQDLWLSEGNYDYYIKCVDLGGNTDTATINFDVETDTSSPTIVRVYHEDDYLKIITDEEAECVYDTVGCDYNFDEGLSMVTLDNLEHFVDWNSNLNFYIKCKDNSGIYPPQNECSIIVRPFNLY